MGCSYGFRQTDREAIALVGLVVPKQLVHLRIKQYIPHETQKGRRIKK